MAAVLVALMASVLASQVPSPIVAPNLAVLGSAPANISQLDWLVMKANLNWISYQRDPSRRFLSVARKPDKSVSLVLQMDVDFSAFESRLIFQTRIVEICKTANAIAFYAVGATPLAADDALPEMPVATLLTVTIPDDLFSRSDRDATYLRLASSASRYQNVPFSTCSGSKMETLDSSAVEQLVILRQAYIAP